MVREKLIWGKVVRKIRQHCQYMNKCFGKINLKIHISIIVRRVLEILIPKSIDKSVFIGYNVDINFVFPNE